MSVASAPSPRAPRRRAATDDGPGSTRLGPRLLVLAAIVGGVAAIVLTLIAIAAILWPPRAEPRTPQSA